MAAAQQTSAVTHGDPAAGWGTAIYHLMVRSAVRGEDPFDGARRGVGRTARRPGKLPHDAGRDVGTVAWRSSQRHRVGLVSPRRCGRCATTTRSPAQSSPPSTSAATPTPLPRWPAGSPRNPRIMASPADGRRTCTVTSPPSDGALSYRLADLQALALRLVGKPAAPEQAVGTPRGPTRSRPGCSPPTWAPPVTSHGDWACDLAVPGRRSLRQPPGSREVFLVDKTGDHNLELGAVVG